MFAASRLLLDHQIDRRAFIRRLTAAGISFAGAASMAEALAGQAEPGPEPAARLPGRVVEGMTGGELTAEFLLEWNVRYVFGLAGSEEVGFLDALVDRLELQYATCLHENVAMAMADGYSRSTGRTPIVQLHSVAAAAYALGQMVNTSRDRVPVVVAAGRQSADYRGQDGFLEAANLHELPRDYRQWIWDVMDPATIPEVLRRAFLLAEAPPGGPAFVTFSKDMWEPSRAGRDPAPIPLPGHRGRRAARRARRADRGRLAAALPPPIPISPASSWTTRRSRSGSTPSGAFGAPLFKHPARSARPARRP